MKKSIALVALAFGVTSAFAQDLTSKKGEPILPEAGDWAVAIDATPFLNYAGNFFGKTAANTAPTWDFATNNATIWGKYFVDANTAYRVGVRLGFGSNTTKNMVADRANTSTISFPETAPLVENKWKSGSTNIGLTAGIEKRKGKTRLQGYYGAEVGIGLSSTKNKFEYGNSLNPTGTPAVVVDAADGFGGGFNLVNAAGTGIVGQTGDARMTEQKSGLTFALGIRGFVGAEYFLFPKISLGGEFGWGLGLVMGGKSKTTYEAVGVNSGGNVTTGTKEVEGSTRTSSVGVDTDHMSSVFGALPAGKLKLVLHF